MKWFYLLFIVLNKCYFSSQLLYKKVDLEVPSWSSRIDRSMNHETNIECGSYCESQKVLISKVVPVSNTLQLQKIYGVSKINKTFLEVGKKSLW